GVGGTALRRRDGNPVGPLRTRRRRVPPAGLRRWGRDGRGTDRATAALLATEGRRRMKEYDIAIIGGGPGGYVAAIRAAQAGACVRLRERDRVGATCLNRGCIPTKALYSTAHLLHIIRAAGAHGIEVGEPRFDFGQAASRKDEVVAKLVGGVEQLLKGN